VAGVGIADALAVVAAKGRADVLILAGGSNPGRLENPDFARFKQVVAVIPAEIFRLDSALIVCDRYPAQGYIPGIGDGVAPGHRIANRY